MSKQFQRPSLGETHPSLSVSGGKSRAREVRHVFMLWMLSSYENRKKQNNLDQEAGCYAVSSKKLKTLYMFACPPQAPGIHGGGTAIPVPAGGGNCTPVHQRPFELFTTLQLPEGRCAFLFIASDPSFTLLPSVCCMFRFFVCMLQPNAGPDKEVRSTKQVALDFSHQVGALVRVEGREKSGVKSTACAVFRNCG